MPVAAFRESSFLWYRDDDTLIPVIRDFPSVPYGVEKWLQDVCGGRSVCLEQFSIEAVFARCLVVF